MGVVVLGKMQGVVDVAVMRDITKMVTRNKFKGIWTRQENRWTSNIKERPK